jgi:hypothetical protein
MKTNYSILANKIKKCNTIKELERIDERLDNLYNNCVLTNSEYSRLTVLVMYQCAVNEVY